MNKAVAYRMKMLSGGDSHQKKIEQGFCDAFDKGYSVVEIARCAGLKSAKYVHEILVKNDKICKAKRGRLSSKIVVPPVFASFLKVRELSFAQWCSGWFFGLHEASVGVAELDGEYGSAVKRDFPRYFSKVSGLDTPDIDFEPGPEYGDKADFDVHIGWDGIVGCYTAEIKDLDLRVYGDSVRDAFSLALIRKNQLDALKRLETLPNLCAKDVDLSAFGDW
jgi:hypothetical protein